MDRGAWKAPIHEAAKESDTTEQLHNNNLTPNDLSASSQAPALDQKSGKSNEVVPFHWAARFPRPALSPEVLTGCRGRTHISLCALCMLRPVTQLHRLSATSCTVAHQAPQSVRLSSQEYWSGLPFLLQRIFLIQESNPYLPCLLHHRPILYRWAPREVPISTYMLLQRKTF